MAKSFVEEFIPQISSVDSVYSFFNGLGYNTLTKDYKTSLSSLGLRSKERDCIDDVYVVSNYDKRFQIYFIKLNSPSTEVIRSLPDLFLKSTHFPFLVFTSDFINFNFVLIETRRKDIGEFKRKLVRLNIDKNNLYHTDLEVLSNIRLTGETRPDDIYNKLTEAFSVQKVTDKFFKEYVGVFNSVKSYLLKQAKNPKDAHDFTQQLLNRLMFIYFVAKKRWLGNDLKFMRTFWDSYCADKKNNGYKPDIFYSDWLSVLFFEAFNNRFAPRQYFSKEFNSILALAPYLNGGLFSKNRLDDIGFELKDSIFEQIFTFFNRYNFTIREEMPLEEEVAVDPEMIGRVYESLVNRSEESDERGEAGIFYTDRVEIDFMSRRSLVEYFYNQLQSKDVSKDIIYRFAFGKTENEIKEIEKTFTRHNLWQNVEDALDNLSVVDPACGSGSFLVGMLNILSGLYKLTYKNLGRPIDDFGIKKQIIGRSLYGVDVMEWACHVAELRLWLQLIVESKLNLGDLKIKPLLPNLTFKIRTGDSLVQDVGGINLSLRNNKDLKPALKRKITELKQEKLKFFNNEPSRKYTTEQLLLHAELNIFREILDDRIFSLTNKIKEKQKGPDTKGQKEFFRLEEISKEADRQRHLESVRESDKKAEEEIEKLAEEKNRLLEIMFTIDKGSKPFVWDIDFVEIFADEFESGFDIVIGNPPYVRQEKIAEPNIPKEKITNENKRQYKEKLLHSVQNHFPFIKSLDKKSDLYVYFYFQGLALLNQRGTFCFITSNSWLDVGYGRDLQEFLLNTVKMHAIYDNSAKRSFARADVNTIIAVFGKPCPKDRKNNYDNTVKFVMFKKPFDDAVTIDNLLKIEKASEITRSNDFRVYPKKQIDLLEEGWEYPEDMTEEQQKIDKFSIGRYEGNKWGGKYLRAPDIFFTILEKGGDNLIRLGDIADVKAGIITGNNAKYYQKKAKDYDTSKYSLVFKSPREVSKILLTSEDAVSIIKIKNIPFEIRKAPLLWVDLRGDKHICHINRENLPFEHNFYGIIGKEIDNNTLSLLLNSTLSWFFVEVLGRKGLGGGAVRLVRVDLLKFPCLQKINVDINSFKKLINRKTNTLLNKFLSFSCHSRASGNPDAWMPASAGMTNY